MTLASSKSLRAGLIGILLTTQVAAEQLSFRKTAKQDSSQFDYRWRDHTQQQHALSFTLKNATMFNRFRQFKAYKPQRVQEQTLMSLKKAAAKLDPRKITIDFMTTSQGIEIRLKGQSQAIIDQTNTMLSGIRDKTQSKYLHKGYYSILTDKFGKSGVKPDHVRFAKESRRDLQPLVAAITKGNPNLRGRNLAVYLLAFIQSIPYSTLENRRASNGAGFSAPLRLINNNQGDCDSKVTLMASILNAIYPNIKIVIIYLPQHALIGIQMTHRKNDKWIKLKDREYILAEPTGPAMLPFAQIAESSEFYIDGRQFTYEIF